MFNWNGCNCSICNKPFQEGEDIVVCPECGTPYHRACYEKEGQCVFSAKHGTGYAYQKPKNSMASVECPVCHTINGKDCLFCENCGAPLAEQSAQGGAQVSAQQAKAGAGGPLYSPLPGTGGYGGAFAGVDIEAALPKDVDGISAADWSEYIGASAPYYLFQFKRMDETGRKTSFCWSALFFAPMYFFYRKMWMWGAISALAFTAVSIPSILQMLIAMNAPVAIGMSAAALDTLSMACFFVNWALSFAFGLFAFYLFRQHAGHKLHEMRTNAADDGAYHTALARSAGPSRLAVVLIFAALFGAGVLLSLWIGPEKVMAYYYF